MTDADIVNALAALMTEQPENLQGEIDALLQSRTAGAPTPLPPLEDPAKIADTGLSALETALLSASAGVMDSPAGTYWQAVVVLKSRLVAMVEGICEDLQGVIVDMQDREEDVLQLEDLPERLQIVRSLL